MVLSLAATMVVPKAYAAAAAPHVPSESLKHRGVGGGHKGQQLRYSAERSGDLASQGQVAGARPAGTSTPKGQVASAQTLMTAVSKKNAMASVSMVGGSWQSVGPTSINKPGGRPYPNESGRVLALASQGATVYLGGADGGIWKSTNLGDSWISLGDNLATLAIGALAVDSVNNIVFAGTGEAAKNSETIRGMGVYRSTNGGASWTLTGADLMKDQSITAIKVDPSNASRVFASFTNGIAMSNDKGQTWAVLTDPKVASQNITDLAIDNSGNLYAARGNQGDSSNGIYYSTDHGGSWNQVYSYGGSNSWVWKLALAPSTAGQVRSHQVLFAVAGDVTIEANGRSSHLLGIFRSGDGGANWSVVGTRDNTGDSGNQAWYDIYVAIKPDDSNTAYVGLTDLYRTQNGGTAWSNISNVYGSNPAAIHPDQHAALFMGTTILFGNDGGVYKSSNLGNSFTSGNGTGLGLSQFYGGDISATATGTMLGGLQDNGNPLTTDGGARWTDISGGDGFYTAIDFTDAQKLYFEYTNGQPQWSTDGGRTIHSVCPDSHELCADHASFGAPLVMDPSSPSTLYSAHDNHLWKTNDGMQSWTGLPSPTAGSTADPTAVAVAPRSASTIYLSDASRNTWVSTDGGSTWTSVNGTNVDCRSPQNSSPQTCGSFGGMITSLAVDPSDSRIVYATVSGYGDAQRGHVFRSTNQGATWQDISTGLPNIPFQSVAISLTNTSTLYAGADVGIYISNDAGRTWSVLGSGLPNARVFHITMRGDNLVAWTHGRSAWKLNLTTIPPPSTAIVSLPTAGGGDACRANELPRNDDNSSSPIQLPFPIKFFGSDYSSAWINNNGNLTFDGPQSTYTPYPLTATNHVIVAPFFADVDTRGTGSDIVTYSYGNGQYAGRPALCVDWINVGYFSGHFDKLNSFQLLMVDRSDIGAGNFDMYFNYNKIEWETGDASGGSNGFGGASARVGFSNGRDTSFELPGSAVPGSFLDSAPTALINSNRGSTTLGRYVFEVRNGVAAGGGSISGTVYANSADPSHTVAGARIQVCGNGGFCFTTSSNGLGHYSVAGLPAADYTVDAYPPTGNTLNPAHNGPITLSQGGTLVGQDLILTGPTVAPSGTTIGPMAHTTPDGVPVVYWDRSLALKTVGCTGGSARYQLLKNGSPIRDSSMAEGPAGHYTATISPLQPVSGNAQVVITIRCTDGTTTTIRFDIYIDPSGKVVTTDGGPVAGATVTLLRSDGTGGPFMAVPAGDGTMSPANRQNPDTTDADGRFGWDVIAGFYKITASKPGCVLASDHSQTVVETPVLTVPPPAENVQLQLQCPSSTTTATVSPRANAAGWNRSDVTVTLRAASASSGVHVTEIIYSASGSQAIPSTDVQGTSARVSITAEGTTTLTFYSKDTSGVDEIPKSVTIKIDKTPPEAYLQFDPNGHDLQVFGRDFLSGVTSVAIAPTKITRGEGDHPSETRTYHVSDLAGNTLDLVVRVRSAGHVLNAQVVTLRYNGGGKLDADRNAIDVRWATDSTGANQQVNQRMEVGDNERDESTREAERSMQQRHTEHQEVTAKWDSTSNQTVIHSASGDTARAGLDLLRLATVSRKLIIEF